MTEQRVYWSRIPTRWGHLEIAVTSRGISELHLPDRARHEKQHVSVPVRVQQIQRQAAKAVDAYFSGKPAAIDSLPLDPGTLTPFAARVLSALRKIPAGRTVTYGDLARKVKSPRAARAVGTVMRKNRIPLLWPCHRVVPTSGGLGRYSGGKGWKTRLLSFESQVAAVH